MLKERRSPLPQGLDNLYLPRRRLARWCDLADNCVPVGESHFREKVGRQRGAGEGGCPYR
jgi:hypothetical protein